jgi:O-antigen ligase
MTDRRRQPIGTLEILVLAHLALFLIAATWLFGGNAEWVRPYLSCWGSLGIILTLAGALPRGARPAESTAPGEPPPAKRRLLRCLWPFVLLNALVLASCATPGFREVHMGAQAFYTPVPVAAWRPSAAVPSAALKGLWLFDGIYLSCFNLFLIVRRRRALRWLLGIAVFNALALSVFGTLQKLMGAKGLFFGLVPSVQTYFFSSFIYHNHWGAYAVLMAAACLGMVRRYASRLRGRGFFRSPGPAGLVVVLLIAMTTPLSTSRSCTALMIVLLGVTFLGWTLRLTRRRRALNESAGPPLLAAGIAMAAAVAAIGFLARESINARVTQTTQQIADMRARGSVGQRAILYRDTWRMAENKPAFGWGMASYPYVFVLYNSQDHPNRIDHLPNNYHDAHNDWLQSIAEHGWAGTALLGLCGLVPLLRLRGCGRIGSLPRYLLAGCGLILLYAWIEFPFGNIAVVLTWWFCFFCAVDYARLNEGGARAAAPAS